MTRAWTVALILVALSAGVIAYCVHERAVVDGLRRAGDPAALREAKLLCTIVSVAGVALLLIGFFADQATTDPHAKAFLRLIALIAFGAAAATVYWSSRFYAELRLPPAGPPPLSEADREELKYTLDDAVWLRRLGLPQEARARVDAALAISPLDESSIKLLFNIEGAGVMRSAIVQAREAFPADEPSPVVPRKSASSRRQAPHGMVVIPAGEFVYQRGDRRWLPEFFMDKFEVTNDQYAKFLEAVRAGGDDAFRHPLQAIGKDHTPRYWPTPRDPEGDPLFSAPDLPVVGIDWFDAWAYAGWAGKRLPTEAEWERAARGPKGNLYPWGDEWDRRRTNSPERFSQFSFLKGATQVERQLRWADWCASLVGRAGLQMEKATLPVEGNRGDLSPYLVRNMAGNVREWTADRYAVVLDLATPGAQKKSRPELEPIEVAITRGGSWLYGGATHTALYRSAARLTVRTPYIGLRCTK